jgi:predicted kinase
MIILMAGLPGTGKTTLARELASRTRGAMLGKDEIRAAVFAPVLMKNGFAQNDIEYSVKQDDFVMDIMLEAASYLLQENPTRHVFFDGRTFSRRYQIERVLAVATKLSQPWKIIECICSDESARRRLDLERDPAHPAHNRNFALYLEVKKHFEPISYPKITIDTDQAFENCVRQALTAFS